MIIVKLLEPDEVDYLEKISSYCILLKINYNDISLHWLWPKRCADV